jgi:hypothetical protein
MTNDVHISNVCLSVNLRYGGAVKPVVGSTMKISRLHSGVPNLSVTHFLSILTAIDKNKEVIKKVVCGPPSWRVIKP